MDMIFSSSVALLNARNGITSQVGLFWQQTRAPLIVPLIRIVLFVCLALSFMLFVERLYMGIVIAFIKLVRRKPEKKYKWEPMKKDDLELGNSSYPVVLVQIPMYNEKEVYQLSIGAACSLSWPANRIFIQVLDDSTDPAIKALVEQECRIWASKGINIKYEIRDNRKGYKAGALREGMKHSYVNLCSHVAIFDADFQPEPDFLERTIPFLVHNPDIGLVQARWEFGTAGVWRMSALNEAGGWKDRTTVEDMDLAVRAGLNGWKFVYVGDLKVKNELPSTFKAYRYQQHRWSCGPANLFRKMAKEIATNKKVSVWKKFYLIYSFFFVRKIIAHVVTFVLYCVVMPATVFVPEVQVPKWGAIYIPSAITLLNVLGSTRSMYLVVYWILFENVMSLHRTKATFVGLFESGRVNEWIVTEKLGDALKTKMGSKASRKLRFRVGERVHVLELFVGLHLLFCGWYDFSFGKSRFYVYLFLQAAAFFVVGFGYIGVFVPNS
ncbi:glucomannan 4-beta-mannosyltransferase 9-like isoform X2 [Nicotiana tomentosiformis]|uniref:glucomannan 4-beta-mannosyltransferase 9-like isoform X2 n=1 Tax=Nicotiana tomentosiformis TaxID=4098 RepID=UPI00051C2B9A|nr:glucomannan 4-beta-mannosyltransferase 9-like isoform X2 [Nicotiana tomentosiformis]